MHPGKVDGLSPHHTKLLERLNRTTCVKCFQDHSLGECEVLGKLSCHDVNGLKQVPHRKMEVCLLTEALV